MKEEYLEILVEERSMENFLRKVLPGVLPAGFVLNQNCNIRPHEGKSHLLKSLPKKVRAYKSYEWPVRMIVLQDQDSNDCKWLKTRLEQLVKENNTEVPFMIRIACRELENWYLGDLAAIEKLYPESRASQLEGRAKYRNPDMLHGTEEMKKLSNSFSKTLCAREIPQYMNFQGNRSVSFNHLLNGLRRFLH